MKSILRNSLIGGGTFLSGLATGLFIHSISKKSFYKTLRRSSNRTLDTIKKLPEITFGTVQSPIPKLFKESDTIILRQEDLRDV